MPYANQQTAPSKFTALSGLVLLLTEKDLHHNLNWNAFDITPSTYQEKWEASFFVCILARCREIWHYQHRRGYTKFENKRQRGWRGGNYIFVQDVARNSMSLPTPPTVRYPSGAVSYRKLTVQDCTAPCDSNVGNGSLMAALDAGCARTLWPRGHTYALVKGRASSEMFSPHLFFFRSTIAFPCFTPSCLYTTFLKPPPPPSYHQSIMILIST